VTALYGWMREENFPSQVTLVGDEGKFAFDSRVT